MAGLIEEARSNEFHLCGVRYHSLQWVESQFQPSRSEHLTKIPPTSVGGVSVSTFVAGKKAETETPPAKARWYLAVKNCCLGVGEN